MDHAIPFLIRYGYTILFFLVLIEQLGLPIPAVPVLLAMGALARSGRFSLVLAVLVAVTASLVSDFVWYELGRRRGRPVLRLICRLTLEPDFCIRRTEMAFASFGPWMLLFAKFVPGLSTAAPPLVAMLGMRRARFIALDGGGALLWAGTFCAAGFFFRTQIERVGAFVVRSGVVSVTVLSVCVVLFIGWKYVQRHRFLRRLRIARITPEELMRKLQDREEIFVADLRHPLEFEIDRFKVPGALRLLPEEVEKRHQEIPRDRDVAVYCNCPNEATSATVALQLRRVGITRVRPLAGGFDAWRARGFPLEPSDTVAQQRKKSRGNHTHNQ